MGRIIPAASAFAGALSPLIGVIITMSYFCTEDRESQQAAARGRDIVKHL